MFKSKKEELFFGILMSFMMALGMEIYNISINNNGLQSWVFSYIWKFNEVPMMTLIVFIVEHFFIGPIALKNASTLIDYRKDNDFLIILITAGCTVMLMCPIMSFLATIIFKFTSFPNIIFVYLQTLAINFPMALLWQIFVAGPFVRKLDQIIFNNDVK